MSIPNINHLKNIKINMAEMSARKSNFVSIWEVLIFPIEKRVLSTERFMMIEPKAENPTLRMLHGTMCGSKSLHRKTLRAIISAEGFIMKNLFDLIIYAASVVGATGAISAIFVKWFDKKLKATLEPIQKQIHKMDVKECRRFLIDFLLDIEHGVEKDEVQWKFAHDVYDHYINELKENSYVKDKWERVMCSGHNG